MAVRHAAQRSLPVEQDKRGGYPAGRKPASELRPPPASVVRPREETDPREGSAR